MSTIPDLSSFEFWERPPAEREAGFRLLRDEHPVSWHREPDNVLMPGLPGTGGYWALTRYDDIRAVSRDAVRFCSGRGVMFIDAPQEFLDAALSILAMDDPRHAAVRRLISGGFSPRRAKTMEEGVRRDVETIVDDLADHEEGDFVELVAKRLPMMTIMRMLGVPESDRERLVYYADAMVAGTDPEYLAGRDPLQVIGEAIGVLHVASRELCQERREHPQDDLVTALVEAEVDGERLSDDEIASFFVLLTVAGNDTTRHTTSHAMVALSENPDQRAALLEDPAARIDTAVEEFVRWASPVMTFRRTATQDSEVSDQAIAAGDKVVLFYPSGNRDERAFERPDRFEVTRSPNRHLGFGGGGPHYCLGAPLAKVQLRTLFTELLARYPELRTGESTPMVGNFVNGINRAPMRRGPRRA